MIWKYWDFWRYLCGGVVNFAFDLAKGIFGKNSFLLKLFQMSWVLDYEQIQVASWHESFMFFCTFGEKFWFPLKKSDRSAELSSTRPRNGNEEKISFGAVKFFDWLCISGGIFCRVVKSAFIVSEQFFSKKINFFEKIYVFFIVFGFWWKISPRGR